MGNERREWIRSIHGIIEKYSPLGKVLSVGGYDGAEFSGCDYEEALIVDLASKPNNLPSKTEYLQSDIFETSFRSNSFDTILMLSMIEHLPVTKIPVLLQRIRNWLKPEGHLILSAVNLARPEAIISLLLMGRLPGRANRLLWDDYPEISHKREYGKWEIEKLLKGTGFKIEEIARVSLGMRKYLPLWWIWPHVWVFIARR